MSRVANNPVTLPKGVDVKIDGSNVSVKGGKGAMEMALADGIEIKVEDGKRLSFMTLTQSVPSRERRVRC